MHNITQNKLNLKNKNKLKIFSYFNISNEDFFYGTIIFSSLILSIFYYRYSKNIYELRVNRVLNSTTDLVEYKDEFLIEYFSLTESIQLPVNFLNNKQLYNFFKNFLVLYPSPEFMLLYLSPSEKFEVLKLFQIVKTGSFEDFARFNISKTAFYNTLYSINKFIFMLEI